MGKTAVIMSKEEALALPLNQRPLCYRISSEMYTAVHEAVGAASMCWEPKPGDQVFASEKASDVAVGLCFKIAEAMESAPKFPDIGQDPCQMRGDKENGSYDRLSLAHCIQQPLVPDQTALVWRIDLSRITGELCWRRAAMRHQDSKTWPAVIAFAEIMEEKLAKNEHKGTWRNDSMITLLQRLYDEAQELSDEITHTLHGAGDFNRLAREAADVANFAMMIADVAAQNAALCRDAATGNKGGA